MPANFIPSSAEVFRILPEIILTVFGTLIMVLEPLSRRRTRNGLGMLTLAGLAAAVWAALAAHTLPGTAFQGMVVIDGFATFFRVLVIAVGLLTLLCSFQYLRREGAESGEYYALLLYSVVGQCLMATANELIMIFIGLEKIGRAHV